MEDDIFLFLQKNLSNGNKVWTMGFVVTCEYKTHCSHFVAIWQIFKYIEAIWQIFLLAPPIYIGNYLKVV